METSKNRASGVFWIFYHLNIGPPPPQHTTEANHLASYAEIQQLIPRFHLYIGHFEKLISPSNPCELPAVQVKTGCSYQLFMCRYLTAVHAKALAVGVMALAVGVKAPEALFLDVSTVCHDPQTGV